MKNLFFAILLMFTMTSANAEFHCDSTDRYNQPNVKHVCHTAFESYVDTKMRIPILDHYEIDAKHELSCNIRKGNFKKDHLILEDDQASDIDYTKGDSQDRRYDIGHLFPAEDGLYDMTIESETMLFTNANPQLAMFNRGIWKSLELKVRDWSAGYKKNLDVWTGPVPGSEIDLLNDRVSVPGEFFKIVIDKESKEAIIVRLKFDQKGKVSNSDLVTSIPNVPVDLSGYQIRTTLWLKPKHQSAICN